MRVESGFLQWKREESLDFGREGFTLVIDCNDRLESVTAYWLAYGD